MVRFLRVASGKLFFFSNYEEYRLPEATLRNRTILSLCLRAKNGAIPQSRFRQSVLFVIREEKQLVLSIEQMGNRDRAADAYTRLIQQRLRARRFARRRVRSQIAIAEPVV